ncbi:Ankyrin repeat and FYVE domain-containing protein 1 [Perkinsus chesapeaki]|uniref:Ankyrin repeat and FYVE domain-containing protein 1 n=1 Tax=Perkinsus chesapeaki TaxID=330153 RepID=A0A7J6MFV5_PERCH|nr:Ankyrin repeat and FYVE domain-containing protein 1 [Perkinsus chesapeaki]
MSFSLKCVHSSSSSTPRYWLHPTKPLAMHQASSSVRTVWDYCSNRYRYLRSLEGGQVLDAWFSGDGADMYTIESTGVAIVWSVKRQSCSSTLPLLPGDQEESLLLASVCEERSGPLVELCVLSKGLHLLHLSLDTRQRSVYVRKCVDVWQPGAPPKGLVCLPTDEGISAALLVGDGSDVTFYSFDRSPDSVPVTRMIPTGGSLVAMAKGGASTVVLLSAAGHLTSIQGEFIKQVNTTEGKVVTQLWQGVGGTCIFMADQGAFGLIENCEMVGTRILPLRCPQTYGSVQACSSVDMALLVQSDGTVQIIDTRSSGLVSSSAPSGLSTGSRIVDSYSGGVVCRDDWKVVVLHGPSQTRHGSLEVARGVRITALSVMEPLMWVGYSDGEIITYVLDGKEWRKRSEYSCDQAPVWMSAVKGAREAYIVFDDGRVGLLEESPKSGDLQMRQEFEFDGEVCKRVEAVSRGSARGDDRYCVAEVGERIVLYEIYRLGKSLVHSGLRKFKWEQDCKWCLSSNASFMTVLRHSEGQSEIEVARLLDCTGGISNDTDIRTIFLPEEAACWQAMTISDDERYAVVLSSPGGGQQVLVLKLDPDFSNTCARLLTDGSITTLAVAGGLLYLGNRDGAVEIWTVKDWPEPRGMEGQQRSGCGKSRLSTSSSRDVVVAAREMGLCRRWLPPEEPLPARLCCNVPSEADHRTVSSTQTSIVERAFNSMDRFDGSQSTLRVVVALSKVFHYASVTANSNDDDDDSRDFMRLDEFLAVDRKLRLWMKIGDVMPDGTMNVSTGERAAKSWFNFKERQRSSTMSPLGVIEQGAFLERWCSFIVSPERGWSTDGKDKCQSLVESIEAFACSECSSGEIPVGTERDVFTPTAAEMRRFYSSVLHGCLTYSGARQRFSELSVELAVQFPRSVEEICQAEELGVLGLDVLYDDASAVRQQFNDLGLRLQALVQAEYISSKLPSKGRVQEDARLFHANSIINIIDIVSGTLKFDSIESFVSGVRIIMSEEQLNRHDLRILAVDNQIQGCISPSAHEQISWSLRAPWMPPGIDLFIGVCQFVCCLRLQLASVWSSRREYSVREYRALWERQRSLLMATVVNDSATAKDIIEETPGIIVDELCELPSLRTPIHFSAWHGNIELCQTLLGCKANVFDKVTADGAMPFALALERGHLDVAKLLIDAAIRQYRYRDRHVGFIHPPRMMQSLDEVLDWTIDRSALLRGDITRIARVSKPLSENEAKVDGVDKPAAAAVDGDAPNDGEGSNTKKRRGGVIRQTKNSKSAAIYGKLGRARQRMSVTGNSSLPHVGPQYIPFIKLLTALGARLNHAVTDDGGTRLHRAAALGKVELVESLCLGRADITLEDANGITPLAIAVQSSTESDTKLVSTLLRFRADPLAQFPRESGKGPRWTPIHCAASRGVVGVVKLLLDFRADAGAYDELGETPLHLAVRGNHKSVVSCMTLFGLRTLDVNATDREGNSPLDVATSIPDNDCEDALACAGASHSVFWYIEQGDVDEVESLARRGYVDFEQVNGFGADKEKITLISHASPASAGSLEETAWIAEYGEDGQRLRYSHCKLVRQRGVENTEAAELRCEGCGDILPEEAESQEEDTILCTGMEGSCMATFHGRCAVDLLYTRLKDQGYHRSDINEGFLHLYFACPYCEANGLAEPPPAKTSASTRKRKKSEHRRAKPASRTELTPATAEADDTAQNGELKKPRRPAHHHAASGFLVADGAVPRATSSTPLPGAFKDASNGALADFLARTAPDPNKPVSLANVSMYRQRRLARKAMRERAAAAAASAPVQEKNTGLEGSQKLS